MKNQFFKSIKNAVNHWYIPLIIGFIFIGIGIWTFASPAKSYLTLSILFSISFLVSGIIEIFFALSNRKTLDNWGWTLVLGIMTTLIGFTLISKPEISMLSLPLYVGFLVMFRSFGAVGLAMDLKNYGVLEWGNLMIVGILGVLFSFILIWNPLFAGMTIVFWTGSVLLLVGTFQVYIAIKLRKLHKMDMPDKVREKYHKFKEELEDLLD